MAPLKQSYFQQQWLVDENYAPWIRMVYNNKNEVIKTLAECSWCLKTIALSNIADGALLSHMNSDKHKTGFKIFKQTNSLNFYVKKNRL